jgi:poly(A) polymerase
MSASDPKRDFAVDVVRRLQQAGFTAFWAGGCVRDFLLGHTPDDYDVATSARPDEVRTLFGKSRTLAIGASFGVILVHGPRGCRTGDVEVATFRTEGPYRDGRRPEHVAFATPQEDALRRDFTINGMFYDPLTDQVFDYVGGRGDLERHVVRAIGEPRARFTEDKLRMLRAVRMTARFDFELDESTAAAVRTMSREILVVSSERIAQELKKMLVHVRRSAAMRLADQLQLLPVILPELLPLLHEPGAPRWRTTLALLDRLEAPSFELAFAVLLLDLHAGFAFDAAVESAASICRRLRLSNDETRRITWLIAHQQALSGAPAMRLSQLKRLLAGPFIDDLLQMSRARIHCGSPAAADIQFCEDYLANTPWGEIDPAPLISGDDLIQLGLKPGSHFKDLLDRVRDAQLEGEVRTRGEAVSLAQKLAGESS